MRILLLAAGFATRLYPLTRDRAKPLLEVAGRPIVSWILDRALALRDVREIVVVSNHRFASDFEAWAASLDVGVPVTVVDDGTTENENRLGAIRDLALALSSSHHPEDPVFVAAGDNLIDFPLTPYQDDAERDVSPLVLYRTLDVVPAGRHGEVTVDEGGWVTRFREKPPEPTSPHVATGMYFFPGDVAGEIERYLDEGGNPDAPGHFVGWLCARRPVMGRPIGGAYFDIGNRDSLEEARARFRP